MGLLQHTLTGQVNIAGVSVPIEIHRTSHMQWGLKKEIAAGHAGALTRSGVGTGVVALPIGHDFEATNRQVAVFWDGGSRYGMTASLDGNNVTLADDYSTSAGDDLPADPATPVVLSIVVTIPVLLGPGMVAIAIENDGRVRIIMYRTGNPGHGIDMDLPCECGYFWPTGDSADPFVEDFTQGIYLYNGETAVNEVTVAFAYDGTL